MLYLVAYIACIVGANWAIATFGVVPIGLGLLAPAGVFFAGFTFSFRNLTQQIMGRRYGYLAIVIGAALSYLLSSGDTIPGGVLPIAVASGLTFLLSETADALVWTQLRKRGLWTGAMLGGDVVGQVIDSVIFLALAFGVPSLAPFLVGQIVGKWYTLVPALLLTRVWTPRVAR